MLLILSWIFLCFFCLHWGDFILFHTVWFYLGLQLICVLPTILLSLPARFLSSHGHFCRSQLFSTSFMCHVLLSNLAKHCPFLVSFALFLVCIALFSGSFNAYLSFSFFVPSLCIGFILNVGWICNLFLANIRFLFLSSAAVLVALLVPLPQAWCQISVFQWSIFRGLLPLPFFACFGYNFNTEPSIKLMPSSTLLMKPILTALLINTDSSLLTIWNIAGRVHVHELLSYCPVQPCSQYSKFYRAILL